MAAIAKDMATERADAIGLTKKLKRLRSSRSAKSLANMGASTSAVAPLLNSKSALGQ
eukprot:CAMPEP_0202088962 /NCGR_PEP_ID=MMETSP0964-20121228/39998_1 /ASSEMBLY_ACC=CAM_ASM_000500 /TAXON_ID=4773 /ORGANISM="Schizochytrium aggregatum, Strain ATCC28209" /LENGTH=56 /DNA_ID=CAMNT_0048657019 /DNA_START=51 /DNA_END=218 /DNA_ORIENTATION=+